MRRPLFARVAFAAGVLPVLAKTAIPKKGTLRLRVLLLPVNFHRFQSHTFNLRNGALW